MRRCETSKQSGKVSGATLAMNKLAEQRWGETRRLYTGSQWWKWNGNTFGRGDAFCGMSVSQRDQLTSCFRVTWEGVVTNCPHADSWALPHTCESDLKFYTSSFGRVFCSRKAETPWVSDLKTHTVSGTEMRILEILISDTSAYHSVVTDDLMPISFRASQSIFSPMCLPVFTNV